MYWLFRKNPSPEVIMSSDSTLTLLIYLFLTVAYCAQSCRRFSLCKPGVGSNPAWDLAGLIPSSGLNQLHFSSKFLNGHETYVLTMNQSFTKDISNRS